MFAYIFILLCSLNTLAGTYVELPSVAGGGGSGVWGAITGTLSNQSDLQVVLDGKLDLNLSETIEPNNQTGGFSYSSLNFNFEPLQNSPNETWNIFNYSANLDNADSGLNFGTTGQAARFLSFNFSHQGSGDIGTLDHIITNMNIGNGTDTFDMKGVGIVYGFGAINNGVTINGPIQGYGIQHNVASGAFMNSYMIGFYDFSDYNTAVESYQSFASGMEIEDVKNNSGVASFSANPTVKKLSGNSGYTGFNFSGTLGVNGIGTGSITGLNLNPTISNNNYYQGVYSSVQSVTGGTKWAGYFDGDVNVTGNLSFGGALSIGALNAFHSQDIADGGGNPTTVHSLVSSVNIPANDTTANGDTIGLNTAMLVSVGANATPTLGAFNLFSALALPAVIETHTGSTLPALQGATFALNFSGSSTGGTVSDVAAGRFLAIPNGITNIPVFKGVWSHQPFGQVGTLNYAGFFEDGDVYSEFKVESEGGFQLATSGAQPTCNLANRGMMWNTEGGTGVADIFQVCMKDAADNFSWVTK